MNNSLADSLLRMADNAKSGSGLFSNLKTEASAFGNTLTSLFKNKVFLGIAGIAGAGRRGEKIGGLQPFQQAVGALPVDVGLIILDEFQLVIHSRLLFIFYGYDTTSRPPAQ